ncbi:dynactin p62 [Auriculariales sp. MPI-PUGE-AT-0066]|nr:dynactin p62 [Auriculariales sp. MPI-PUGE-AT-0066]
MPRVKYYCPCLATNPVPPPPLLPSSTYSLHEHEALYFCVECDAIRCNRCVAVEVSGYYCPNCLFEVPSASVRAEKNRCARNCFQCPNCHNTLQTVASDPPEGSISAAASAAIGVTGEPPYFLFCNFCRWDSTEVGVTFEKATGLAAQLQKTEETAPDVVEFERLKEHFEPFLRAPHNGAIAHSHSNPIISAASSALARDISLPGLTKYSGLLAGRRGHSSRSSEKTSKDREELAEFRARVEAGSSAKAVDGERDWIARLERVEDVARVEQRWTSSWMGTSRARDLRPLRVPLHSKKSKRCPMCRHIIIKPEQKSQSVRYKIKLTATSFLPAIAVTVPPPTATAAAAAAADPTATIQFNAGRTYQFRLAFTNPMYESITVTLAVQRPPLLKGRPSFAVSLPSPAFGVAAFAEAWEYEDEDETMEDEDIDALLSGAREQDRPRSPKKPKTVGVLEKKANTTVVGGELVIGKEGRGEVKFNLLVTYTYQAEETGAQEDAAAVSATKNQSKKAASQQAELKTLAFYTTVDLGVIIPRATQEPGKHDREETVHRRDSDVPAAALGP